MPAAARFSEPVALDLPAQTSSASHASVAPEVQVRRHPHRGEGRRVLATDDAGTDHDQALRQRLEVQQLVGVVHAVVGEGKLGGMPGRGAGGDDDLVAVQLDFGAVGLHHAQRMRIDEARAAVQPLDAVLRETALDELALADDDVIAMPGEVGDRRLATSDRSTPKSWRECHPESASAVSRRVLLGMVPELIPAPPREACRSTSATRPPKIAETLAPTVPAGPPPITRTS